MIQYLEYYPKYAFILMTMKAATPDIIRTSVGIFPLMMGVSLFATAVFLGSNRFNSVSLSMMNLYCSMIGDELQDVFRDLTGIRSLAAMIFLFFSIFMGFS